MLRRLFMQASVLVEAMRPRHWIKNLVVGAAPFFALADSLQVWGRVAGAVVATSMVASAFYLLNDVRDAQEDRRHPVKKERPLAEGRLSVAAAVTTACLLLGLGGGFGYAVAPSLAAVLGTYGALQIAYNLGLKRWPVFDILSIAGGFVLRALGGAAAAGVAASTYFLLCVGLLALFLGIGKRKAEMKAQGDTSHTRGVLQYYSVHGLRRMEWVVMAGAVCVYALWALEGTQTPWMLATLPLVVGAMVRYRSLAEGKRGETPELTLVTDAGMLAATGLWAGITLVILLLTR